MYLPRRLVLDWPLTHDKLAEERGLIRADSDGLLAPRTYLPRRE
ncbi:MAG: hypothetical protein QXP31_08380 [Pyrobaculum sp.]